LPVWRLLAVPLFQQVRDSRTIPFTAQWFRQHEGKSGGMARGVLYSISSEEAGWATRPRGEAVLTVGPFSDETRPPGLAAPATSPGGSLSGRTSR
jgi:hypothetical protein